MSKDPSEKFPDDPYVIAQRVVTDMLTLVGTTRSNPYTVAGAILLDLKKHGLEIRKQRQRQHTHVVSENFCNECAAEGVYDQ